LADIISIATAVPEYCHRQNDIIEFMAKVYKLDQQEKRKLSFLYKHSGIETRYSVIDDYSLPEHEWDFLPLNGNSFPSLEERVKVFDVEALKLSLKTVKKCIDGFITPK
jgi:predicted naringenin-chalcone synthase